MLERTVECRNITRPNRGAPRYLIETQMSDQQAVRTAFGRSSDSKDLVGLMSVLRAR